MTFLGKLKAKKTRELLGGQINKLILAGIFASAVMLPGVAQAATAYPDPATTDGKMTVTGNTIAVNNYHNESAWVCWQYDATDTTEHNVQINSSTLAGVYGGDTTDPKADIVNNTLSINNSSIKSYACGGYALRGNASNNKVIISNNSTIGEWVKGGLASSGSASNNKVSITDSKVYEYISGGDANYNAEYNEVFISKSIIGTPTFKNTYGVRGGKSSVGTAKFNTVNISNESTIYIPIYGGESIGNSNQHNAENNEVSITSSSAVVGNVYGGYSKNGTATNNTVTISNSTVDGDVYGGYSGNSGATTSNNVYIADNAIITGVVHGGNTLPSAAFDLRSNSSESSGETTDTSNTLHVSGLDNQAANIINFDKFEFDITDAYADKSVMLKLTGGGDTVITDDVNVSISIADDAKINNRTISLIAKQGEDNTPVNGEISGFTKEQKIPLTQGVTLSYNADLKLANDKKALNLTFGEGTVNEIGKSVVETRAGAGFIVNNMVDFMLSSGMTQAQAAVDDDTCAPFVAVGGNNTRYNTGSHIDVDGWNAIVGFAKQAGNATYGVAVEHGRGDYDSYVGAVHGEGDIKSTGGALFAQIKSDNGLHYDASLRAGKVDTDYKSGTTSYDDDATYYGLTLGAGKELKLTGKASLDLYGRYYFSHIAGSDARLSSGEAVDFDAVDSHRIRLGGRYTSQLNEKSSAYAGVAWQYEFGGDAEAAINGVEAPTPSLQGHSAVLEAGYKLQSGKNMSLGFNVTGWLGKQRGIGGTLGAQWTF